jgi:hypothetical protein
LDKLQIYLEYADDGTPSLWVNNVESTYGISNYWLNYDTRTWFGKRNVGTYAECQLDEVRFYNKRLEPYNRLRVYAGLEII